MASFFGALGRGLENYGKARLQHSAVGRMFNGPQGQVSDGSEQIGDMDRDPATMTPDYMSPDQNIAPPPSAGGLDAFGGGKVVTKPTVAMLGDKGPEAVVPLNSQPGQKLSPGLLGGSVRTRWQRPSGPNAMHRVSPIKPDLPLKPNSGIR